MKEIEEKSKIRSAITALVEEKQPLKESTKKQRKKKKKSSDKRKKQSSKTPYDTYASDILDTFGHWGGLTTIDEDCNQDMVSRLFPMDPPKSNIMNAIHSLRDDEDNHGLNKHENFKQEKSEPSLDDYLGSILVPCTAELSIQDKIRSDRIQRDVSRLFPKDPTKSTILREGILSVSHDDDISVLTGTTNDSWYVEGNEPQNSSHPAWCSSSEPRACIVSKQTECPGQTKEAIQQPLSKGVVVDNVKKASTTTTLKGVNVPPPAMFHKLKYPKFQSLGMVDDSSGAKSTATTLISNESDSTIESNLLQENSASEEENLAAATPLGHSSFRRYLNSFCVKSPANCDFSKNPKDCSEASSNESRSEKPVSGFRQYLDKLDDPNEKESRVAPSFDRKLLRFEASLRHPLSQSQSYLGWSSRSIISASSSVTEFSTGDLEISIYERECADSLKRRMAKNSKKVRSRKKVAKKKCLLIARDLQRQDSQSSLTSVASKTKLRGLDRKNHGGSLSIYDSRYNNRENG